MGPVHPRHPGGTSWHTGGDREHGRLPLLPPGRIHYRGMDIGGRRLAPLGRLNRSFPRALTFRAERRGEIMVRSRKLYRRSNDSCSRPEPSVRYCNQEDEAGQMLALTSLEQPRSEEHTSELQSLMRI